MTSNDLISLISFIVVMAMLAFFMYTTTVLFFRNRKYAKVIAQLVIDNDTITNQFADHVAAKNIEESEGFLRFITQSRDWAFEYIEDVQGKLNSFVETVGPVMTYYDKYGRINESPSMNTIYDAYTELIKALPESNENEEKQNG